jgi:hypothetical protein
MSAYNPLFAPNDGIDDYTFSQPKHQFSVDKLRWWRRCLAPTKAFSCRQKFWMVQTTVVTVGASFGITFAAGCLMMANTRDPSMGKMLFNYTGTAILTPLLNWIISGSLMSMEAILGLVPVIDSREVSWWPREDMMSHGEPYKELRWWLVVSDLVLAPSYYPSTRTWNEFWGSYLNRFLAHVTRAVPWIIVSLLTTVPLFYLFSYYMYKDTGFNNYPQPEFLTAIQSGLITLLMYPIWTQIALVNIGSKLVHDPSYTDHMGGFDPSGERIA